jgi:F-type H+-transporting ATPase subunit a
LHISPDEIVYWKYGFVVLNSTIATTWGLMLVLVVGSILVTRKIKTEGAISRWQGFLEIVVTSIQSQIKDVGLTSPKRFVGFIGTLFIFIAFANLCTILPFYDPPTGSLSTTIALAMCVFIAVPLYGILGQGFLGYLKTYIQPTIIMLPFNIMTQVSRTLALAVRLFGNTMSAVMIVGILLTITPLFFPIFMNLLGLLTGMVQAYIFSILAAVYIAAAMRSGDI